MHLAYLYFKSSTYPHKQHLFDSFNESEMVDIEEIEKVGDKDIYIVELNDIDKFISKKLVNLFENKENALIYFIIPKKHTLLLFQLAFFLKTKAIITHTQNVKKVLSKIRADKEELEKNTLEKYLGSIKVKMEKFLIFKGDTLFYVSEALLDTFSCEDMHTFEKKILKDKEIYDLLDNESSFYLDTQEGNKQVKGCVFRSKSVFQTDTVVYVDEEKSVEPVQNVSTPKGPIFISSRVAFIEQLKESILQKNISQKNLSLLSINIIDIKKLLLEYDVVKVEEILLEILTFIESSLQNKLIFSQFQNNFYVVLLEDVNFKKIKSIAEDLYDNLLAYMEHKEIDLPVEFYSFGLESQEFSKILTTLDEIANDEFKKDEIDTAYIQHLSNQSNSITEKKLLSDAFKNQLQLKILNIYNGLVINTTAKIIKLTDSSVYITFESLQGVVLNLEKQTVLQSEYFFQDIHAEVREINQTKKVAILENFKFLKTNANSRKYARVTTAIKIPATLNINARVVTGTILDLSIKSLAVQVKNISGHPMVEEGKGVLVFNLPSKMSENGYKQLKINVKIVVVTSLDINQYYKVVCDLDQNSHDLDIILHYVYERQKELIIELKKMSKLN